VSEPKPWISVKDAADLFSVHPETIRRMVREQKVVAARFPTGTVRISRADLDRVLGLTARDVVSS
jgi:excisionase family DNA binding protein